MSYKINDVLRATEGMSNILRPHCELGRFSIAGSIRRGHNEVKDIEIVCQPKKELKKNPELMFDEGSIKVSGDFIHALATITGAVIKGNPEGRYMQIKTSSKICPGIYLDLFMPAAEDYFRQLAIRSGSSEYVANIIASAWVRNGWVGTGEHGLRRREDCEEVVWDGNRKWKLINPAGQLPPVWTSEAEFFEWLGLKWISPALREYKPTVNVTQ